MMRSAFIIVLMAFFTSAQSQSEIRFEIKNFGSTVEGRFTEFSLNIQWNDSNPLSSKISGIVQVKSINTGIGLRDNHLRSSSYFDAEKFPTITFTAIKIEKAAGKNEYQISGMLTIKNSRREETFTMKIDERGRKIFTTTINRRAYQVGGKSLTMADDVKVIVVY